MRYRRWVKPYHRTIAGIVVGALISLAIDAVWPLASAYVIDHVLLASQLGAGDKIAKLCVFAGVAGVLFGLNALLNAWRGLRVELLFSKLGFTLRSRLFGRLLRLPLGDVTELKTGGALQRLSSDVDAAGGLLWHALLGPLLACARLLTTVVLIVALSWQMALLVLLTVPPVLLIQHVTTRRLRTIWKAIGDGRQRIDARVSEVLGGLRVVRGYRRERREELAYAVGHHTVIRQQMLATKTQRTVSLIWDLVLPTAQVLVLAFGGYLVVEGRTTVGTLVAFQAYLVRLLEPVMQMAASITETQRGLAALERVTELLDKPEEKPDRPHARRAPFAVRQIHFDNVSFGYEPGRPVLQAFELEVKGGSTVALVGASGAGKTTVTDLLARFFDPTAGSIRLNGVDVRDFKLESYRSLFAVVQQETFLFDGTIAENIAYGRPAATREQIEEAARRANALEFIECLPDRYQTVVGDRGVKLSGGQRQRLAIARALLADPAILILDEATSSLDSKSEQLIQVGLAELLRDRTTFVVAHRLSTVQTADLIVVLDRGKIREKGTHAELMHASGIYRAMVELQREAMNSAGRGELDQPLSPPAA